MHDFINGNTELYYRKLKVHQQCCDNVVLSIIMVSC